MKRAVVLGSIVAVTSGCGFKAMFQTDRTTGLPPNPLRRQVQRTLDPAANEINLTPKKTTIQELLAVPRPLDLAANNSTPKYQALRVAPLETQVWTLEANLIRVVKHADKDIYLVLEDGGKQMAVEAVHPDLADGSPYLDRFTNLYRKLESQFKPNAQPQETKMRVQVTGIGFFGWSSKKEGAPSNGARLMPLFDFRLVN